MFGSLQFPRVKMLLHALQGFVIFLGWALTIAVLTQDGPTDGRTAYCFALCWLTVPALIYLAAVPLWPRTQRFGNAYAFAVIDVLFGILWFASWVAVASYVAAGKVADKDDDNDKDEKAQTLLHNEADDLGGMPHETPAPPSMYDATRGNDNSNALNNTPLTNAGDANASYLHDNDTSYGGAYAAGSRSQASASFHDQYTNR
ncbi:hypothetical protein I7I51_06685 [Histoplasma capsulatum]|uniref:MARVEL domain-containing protein n=1 Tax=Ajellomyces capsulatus TaxID=5037 RepID=A0A8A1MMC3_AJECA|nr:hypothetical protein I7I51_06685 [Histoplasma capsulatum]